MYSKVTVVLAKKLWDESDSKAELKQKISQYMNRNYPHYRVIEIHKYYAICERR